MADTDDLQRRLQTLFATVRRAAAAALTRGEIGRTVRRLDAGWRDIPDETKTPDAFAAVRAAYDVTFKEVLERRRAINMARPVEDRTAFDQAAATVETFFVGPQRHPPTASRNLADVEKHLAIALPETLRALYARRNGGLTDFAFVATCTAPEHDFVGSGSHPTSYHRAMTQWHHVVPDDMLHPWHELMTLGELADLSYEPDDEEGYRVAVEDCDRLVILAQHGWDEVLCLDYRGGAEPSVGLLDISGDPTPAFTAPDFATFFAALRRPAILVEDGERCRGMRSLDDDE